MQEQNRKGIAFLAHLPRDEAVRSSLQIQRLYRREKDTTALRGEHCNSATA